MTVLAGKVALVTGARTGLGAATVAALAELGATVIASGRRAGNCAEAVASAAERGGAVHDFALDVSDLGAIAGRMTAAIAAFGRIDIVVNNAATIEPMAEFGNIDPLAFDAALRLNVSGPAAIVSALWPHLTGGRIINIVSGAANDPLSGWAAYCASKSSLLMLSRSMALEGSDRGIKAFAFAPGLVDTAMQASIRTAKINAISAIPRQNLLPAATPARIIGAIATGAFDEWTGRYLDIRQDGLMARLRAQPKKS